MRVMSMVLPGDVGSVIRRARLRVAMGGGAAESLDQGSSEAPLGQGKNRKTGGRVTLHPIRKSRSEEKLRTEAEYFERNKDRLPYPKFRRQHLFVGSGVIEAGCKTVIVSRLKQSGMFWTIHGANAILALRCCHFNGRFEDYCEGRRAAIAA